MMSLHSNGTVTKADTIHTFQIALIVQKAPIRCLLNLYLCLFGIIYLSFFFLFMTWVFATWGNYFIEQPSVVCRPMLL